MAITRRSVLLQGSAVGAGLVASSLTGVGALAQQTPRRRSIGELSPNDPIVEAYREGVARLRESSGRVSWASIAGIHGNENGFNRCPHGNWYFLPWHRAYLVMYENIIREITGMREFALPYWDWTRDRTFPRVFAEETFNGRPNPLYERQRDIRPNTRLADENVGQAVIDEILEETNYEVFGTSRPRGQNNTNGSWVSRNTGNQGPLEANPHNNVHGTVGGMMGTSASAGDPIFWLHHANVDRIWTLWNAKGNQNSTNRMWTDMTFRNHFFDPRGRAYSATVRELQETEPLGYIYEGASEEASRAIARAPSPAVRQERERLALALERIGGDGETRRSVDSAVEVPVFTSDNDTAGEAQRPLAVAVRINQEVITRSLRSTAAPAQERPTTRGDDAYGGGATSMQDLIERRRQQGEYGSQNDREETARPQAGPAKLRAIAFIESLDCNRVDTTQVRVFIDCDYLSQSTPISDNHYVGTFGFFGPIGQHGGHGAGHGDGRGGVRPSVMVDMTEALEKVYGDRSPGEQIQVQLLPVPNARSETNEVGRVIPARISIAFI